MTGISKSRLQAAVSAIMERDQSEPPPSRTSQRADLSALRRAYHDRLRSELADGEGGLFQKLGALSDEYKEEVVRVLDRQIPPPETGALPPTRGDQEWIDNKKKAYELIAGRPLVTFPVVIDAPAAIYSAPSGSLLDSHIESWGSWATWSYHDTRNADWEFPESYYKYARLNFLFAWQNESANPVVIKRASADLSIRGFCGGVAWPALVLDSWVDFNLRAHHRVLLGTSVISASDEYIFSKSANMDGWLTGGIGDFEAVEPDLVKHLASHDVLVPSNQFAIFQVGIDAEYLIFNGQVRYVFAGSHGRIICPSLALELSLVVHP